MRERPDHDPDHDGAEAIEPDGQAVKTFYGELTHLIQRLHRRFLEVVRIELESLGVRDINAEQALILITVREEELLVRDLIQRCYYLGSSTSYNIKKLVECGYLEQERSGHDRRAVRIRLNLKGRELFSGLRLLQDRHAEAIAADPAMPQDIDHVRQLLRRLERVWAEFIDFG